MTAPKLSGLTTNIAYTEDAAPVFIDPDVTIDDAEGDFDGGTIVISDLESEDVIQLIDEGTGPGQLNVSGTTILLGSTPVATIDDTGSTYTITFLAGATTALVEQVLERLAYSNTSQNPVSESYFTITVTDANGEVGTSARFQPRAVDLDPFQGFDFDTNSAPTLVDWDSDGDMDIVVAATAGDGATLIYLRNEGGLYGEVTGAENPFDGIVLEPGTIANVQPAIGDVDGDGDLDLVVGGSDGTVRYWEGTAGGLVELTGPANPFGAIDVGDAATAALVDLDGDLDLDLVLGDLLGGFSAFSNDAFVFNELTGGANPFDGFDAGTQSSPAFGDIDGDSDADLVVANADGFLSVYQNDGGSYTLLAGADNPLDGFVVGSQAKVAVGDVDGDGDIDVIAGDVDGGLSWFENIGGLMTVTITGVDDLPVAVDDAAQVDENGIAVIQVADNDSNGDGGVITVTDINGVAAPYATPIALPSGAIVTLNFDGSITYDPNGVYDLVAPTGAANSSAADSFTYTLDSGSTATVAVTIVGVVTPGDRALGTGGDDAITGSESNDLIMLAGGGSDTASGGRGSDGFYMGAALDATDAIDGGTDFNTFDQLGLQGDYTYTFGAANLVGIELLVLLSGSEAGYGDPGGGANRYDYNLTTVDANVAAGERLTINGNQLLAGEDVFFNGTAETDGAFRFNMSAGSDTLIGGDGADEFSGGWGQDTMTGGDGNDIFFFRQLLDSTTGASDAITDFTAGDRINLFALDANTGLGGNQAFAFIGSAAFTNAAGQLRVDGSGTAWTVEVDTDGDGNADLAIDVTTTVPGYGWSAADFVL